MTGIAADLLGKVLISDIEGKRTSGIIVETEAYSWKERGCHAFQNKMTPRNAMMFREGGVLYVYLCYGIHQMINIVTGKAGSADAVLIRALQPLEGLEVMMNRASSANKNRITSGPGKLTRALGIKSSHNGLNILNSGSVIQIANDGMDIGRKQIVASSRIGINYAGADADLRWRFCIKNNPWVSISPVKQPGK